jgi:hypothetical protein
LTKIKLKYVNAFANRSRKSERLRYYFRRRGCKAIPLPGFPGSEEFMAAYQAALAGISQPPTEIGASKTMPGSINALVVAYYRSEGSRSAKIHEGRASRLSSASGRNMVISARCTAPTRARREDARCYWENIR